MEGLQYLVMIVFKSVFFFGNLSVQIQVHFFFGLCVKI